MARWAAVRRVSRVSSYPLYTRGSKSQAMVEPSRHALIRHAPTPVPMVSMGTRSMRQRGALSNMSCVRGILVGPDEAVRLVDGHRVMQHVANLLAAGMHATQAMQPSCGIPCRSHAGGRSGSRWSVAAMRGDTHRAGMARGARYHQQPRSTGAGEPQRPLLLAPCALTAYCPLTSTIVSATVMPLCARAPSHERLSQPGLGPVHKQIGSSMPPADRQRFSSTR